MFSSIWKRWCRTTGTKIKKCQSYGTYIICGAMVSSCGAVTTSTPSAFKLRMVGVYEVPAGATGTEAPRSHTISFKSLKLTAADGSIVSLYAETPKVFKIIDRPQLLYANYDMTTYEGTSFSKAAVEFDPSIVVSTKSAQDSTITLDSGALELNETFSITKAKNQTLTIKIYWGRTITEVDGGTDIAQAPIFNMVYSND